MIARKSPAVWILLAALGAPPAAAQEPSRLVIDPNAIVEPGEPVEVLIEGVAKGTLRLWILRDCDRDGQPDHSPECPPLFERESAAAKGGVIRDRLEAALLATLPKNESLWLRAAAKAEAHGKKATFTLSEDPCSAFDTVADLFLRGECKPPSLPQVLRRHRQPSDLQDAVFEVRRLDFGAESAEPVTVAGTRGASGVAWSRDGKSLWVTIAEEGRGDLAPGVYAVGLGSQSEEAVAVWTPEPEVCRPHAPLALSSERVAVVCQASGPQRQDEPEEVARLVVIEGGAVRREVPLPFKGHQLLAASDDGTQVLALSLGIGDNQPVFLSIELEGQRVEVLGFSNAFYQAVMREPGGGRSLVAYENAYGGYGWQIALADGEDYLQDLVKRDGVHDLAPAWHPAGGELVFLAQVGTASSPH